MLLLLLKVTDIDKMIDIVTDIDVDDIIDIAYDIDNYDKTLSFLDDSLMKDFSRETVFVKIFQCIKHLKNDLFTIRMMFFSMLKQSFFLWPYRRWQTFHPAHACTRSGTL